MEEVALKRGCLRLSNGVFPANHLYITVPHPPVTVRGPCSGHASHILSLCFGRFNSDPHKAKDVKVIIICYLITISYRVFMFRVEQLAYRYGGNR
jgi:hypothetical protein